MAPRFLVVIADDYGIGPETSRGILELAGRGVVTGTVLTLLGRYESWRQEVDGFPGNDWLAGITDPPWVKAPDFFVRWLTRVPGWVNGARSCGFQFSPFRIRAKRYRPFSIL